MDVGPIPQCSFNVSSPSTVARFHIGSYFSFPPSSLSFSLTCSDSSKMLPHLCRIPQKYIIFGGSNTHPSIFLKSRSKIGISCFTTSAGSRTIGCRQIPARDRVIDFGKYKGKMLGTLPSKYLKWVTKNLRAREFEEWAQLADEVLSDTVYNDRIEWEFAQNLLNGDVPTGTQNAVSELLEISSRFGWDNEDKLGWSKIDFEMLGTSKGGRIPRLSDKKSCMNSIGVGIENKKGTTGVDSREEDEKDNRERRWERVRLQKRKNEYSTTMTETRGNTNIYNTSSGITESSNRFPGRESLLKKALSLRTRKSF